MSKPLIVVATPCYGGLVTQTYMTSVLKLTQHAARGDLDLDVMLLGGDALISRARSLLVAHMLDNPRATHLLFIDADIAFEVEQVLRLMRFDKDFVAGFYPVKQIDWQQVPRRALEGEPLTSAGLTYVGTLCERGSAASRGRLRDRRLCRNGLPAHPAEGVRAHDGGLSRAALQEGSRH